MIGTCPAPKHHPPLHKSFPRGQTDIFHNAARLPIIVRGYPLCTKCCWPMLLVACWQFAAAIHNNWARYHPQGGCQTAGGVGFNQAQATRVAKPPFRIPPCSVPHHRVEFASSTPIEASHRKLLQFYIYSNWAQMRTGSQRASETEQRQM